MPAATAGRPDLGEVTSTARFLERYWRQRADTGFDPYDALETDRLAFLTRLPRYAQLAVVQLNKRSPVNLRRLEGVRPTTNPYTVAHFASACAILGHLGEADWSSGFGAMADRLDWSCDNRVADAWAYPFDTQTKTFAYPKTTPNVICTSFTVEALLDGIEALGDSAAPTAPAAAPTAAAAPTTAAALTAPATVPAREAARIGEAVQAWREAARKAVVWSLENLYRQAGGRQYFCYLPTETLLIHNANVLAARFVARAGRAFGEDEWVETARGCLEVTVSEIDAEGLLPYGEGDHEAWVDGHHTGFVAEALLDLSKWLEDPGLAELAARVRGGYRAALFEDDGRPLLFPGRQYPVDVITGAQGIQTFAMAGSPDDVAFAQLVAGYMLANMRSRRGTFVYRKLRTHAKAVPYVRWSDAPMCLALARLARALTPAQPAVAMTEAAPREKKEASA